MQTSTFFSSRSCCTRMHRVTKIELRSVPKLQMEPLEPTTSAEERRNKLPAVNDDWALVIGLIAVVNHLRLVD